MIKRSSKIIGALTLIVSLGAGTGISYAATKSTNVQPYLAADSSSNKKDLLSKSVLLHKDKKDAVTLWAEALKRRDGSLRYAILSNDLKKQEYNKYSKMNWVIGGSSPWVISYKINQKNKIDNKTYEYEINYTFTDSTRISYEGRERITVKLFGNKWIIIKHDNYDGLPALKEKPNSKFSKVQLPVLDNALVPRDKESTVELWAEALKRRDGSLRYAILSNDLKKQEYNKYSKMNWVIGGSSPWVISYKINQKNRINNQTYEYEINYTLTDSTKASYKSRESITVKASGGEDWFVIKHDNYDYMPDITKNVNSNMGKGK